MVPKQAYPPMFHHPKLTKRLTPAEAQASIAAFLEETETKPYLHPDAQLSASGITFAAQSGPKGGLAIHHLRRIEAGLRGENLVAESAEDLVREFATGEDGEGLPEGDDKRLDEAIGKRKRKRSEEEVAQWAEESSEAAFGESRDATGGAEWQDKEGYALGREQWDGEVGQREPARVVEQGGTLPEVVETVDKAARRAEKKARRNAEKAEKLERNAKG